MPRWRPARPSMSGSSGRRKQDESLRAFGAIEVAAQRAQNVAVFQLFKNDSYYPADP